MDNTCSISQRISRVIVRAEHFSHSLKLWRNRGSDRTWPPSSQLAQSPWQTLIMNIHIPSLPSILPTYSHTQNPPHFPLTLTTLSHSPPHSSFTWGIAAPCSPISLISPLRHHAVPSPWSPWSDPGEECLPRGICALSQKWVHCELTFSGEETLSCVYVVHMRVCAYDVHAHVYGYVCVYVCVKVMYVQ